jgi:hypothetical protein
MSRRTSKIAIFSILLMGLFYIVLTSTQNLREVYGKKNMNGKGSEVLHGEFLIWETMGNTVLSRSW